MDIVFSCVTLAYFFQHTWIFFRGYFSGDIITYILQRKIDFQSKDPLRLPISGFFGSKFSGKARPDCLLVVSWPYPAISNRFHLFDTVKISLRCWVSWSARQKQSEINIKDCKSEACGLQTRCKNERSKLHQSIYFILRLRSALFLATQKGSLLRPVVKTAVGLITKFRGFFVKILVHQATIILPFDAQRISFKWPSSHHDYVFMGLYLFRNIYHVRASSLLSFFRNICIFT